MKKLYYIAVTMRPVNMVLTAISVAVGYWFVLNSLKGEKLLFAAVSAAFICAGGNIFNDFYDIEIDRINKPDRPFASGKLGYIEMGLSGFIVFFIGLLLSAKLGMEGILIAASTVFLLLLYDKYVKKTVLIGNFIVSVLAGLAFIYGSAAGGDVTGAVVPAIFAMVYHFGREILKDIEDTRGDKQGGARTFAVKYGENAAIILAAVTYTVLIVLTFVPYFVLNYSLMYLAVVIVFVDLFIIIILSRYVYSRDFHHLKQLNSLLKAGMLAGLIALLLH
ncbi:geranylgeranylglycerol-phosphate geranylgeranyltransferase [candidate division KSB1 bacterium]